MSEKKSPLARLVLFMVCLSVAGAVVSGVYTFAVEQPQQQSVTAPTNYDIRQYTACREACYDTTGYSIYPFDPVKTAAYNECTRACRQQFQG